MSHRSIQTLFALILGSSILPGCGSGIQDRAITTVPVSGKVFMGSTPLSGATVTFTPAKDTKGTGGYGVSDAEGKFEVNVSPDKKGIEAGTYIVTFTKWAQKDGSPIPEGKTAADVMAVQVIPDAYSNPGVESPPNMVTVPAGGGSFDFQIPAAK